jgi:glycosyltransferase involved in cell wall biosynthesis
MNKSVVLIFLGDFFFDARCINMADTIIDSGLELIIIDSGKSDNNYREKSIHHILLPERGLIKYLKFNMKVKDILSKLQPEIIIAGDLYSLPAATSIKRAHVVYDSRELYTQLGGLNSKPLRQHFWSWIEKKYITKVQSVIVTAPGDGTILNNIYNNLNLVIIYNFPSRKMIPTGKYSLRKKLKLSKEKTIFLYQGVLHEGRGIKQMIKLLIHFKNAIAVIIGEGTFKNKFKNYAQSLGLGKRTHFYGAVPYLDLLEVSADANIGFSLIKPISKSYEQALPNKLFEYALAGIPIIASKLPEMEKVIIEYKIGYTVDFDDLNAQIEAVTKILNENNRVEIQKIAENNLVWESQQSLFLKTLESHG